MVLPARAARGKHALSPDGVHHRGGTPALFLYQDRSTMVKGQGALTLVGLQGWSLPAGLAASGLLVPAAMELWIRREAVSTQRLKKLALGGSVGADPARRLT